jgi:hypothetical protein
MLLTSCSQRYAHRSKVKVGEKAKKESVIKDPSVIITPEINPSVLVQNEDILPVVPKTEPISPEKATGKKLHIPLVGKVTKKVEKTLGIPLQKSSIIKLLPSKIKKTVLDDEENNQTEVSSHWLRVVIIGLVLILIGVLLGNLLIGQILYIVGSVVVVIGLIMLLLELL